MKRKITVNSLTEWKRSNKRFAMVTACDYTSARLVNEAEIPVILVGDSIAMTAMGLTSTIPVTLQDIIRACRAVRRGAGDALVVADMPFFAAEPTPERALVNAAQLLQKGRADAVKLEGGSNMEERVERIVSAGIPVMGHIGLQPQSINKLGKYYITGKTEDEREKLNRDAEALERAGAFAVVLELVEPTLAAEISNKLTIPTIGIGSGAQTDAQVQVFHDLVGLTPEGNRPKHARVYAETGKSITEALAQFREDVKGASQR